jgi:nucleoside transporter
MSPTAATPMGTPASAIAPRLSVMMFLQFFLWGAWFVTLGPFMGSRGAEPSAIGNAYTTAPIGAILAPIFLGMIADRFFATQIVLGLLHILGGALLLMAPSLAPQSPTDSPWPFVGVLLGHMLCYMPTLGLSTSLAFAHMTNPEKQFPIVRVLGTIGWIVAGFAVSYGASLFAGGTVTDAAGKASVNPGSPHFFYIAGASGILLGLYSFSLPNTPPPAKGKPFSLASALGFDALALLKDRNFAIFCLCSFLLCIPLAAYYSFAATYAGATGITNLPVKMSFGQMSEIIFMLVMPLCFASLGVKWMLAVGMLAWVVRYGLFGAAWQSPGQEHIQWMVLAGIILHGVCYDFFFVTGMIYGEKRAPEAVRAQTQSMLVLLTQGLGMLVGNQLFPRLVATFTTTTNTTGQPTVVEVDWKMVWFVPAGFALLVLIFFIAAFNPPKDEGKAQG